MNSPLKNRKECATTAPYNLSLNMRKKESKKIGEHMGTGHLCDHDVEIHSSHIAIKKCLVVELCKR